MENSKYVVFEILGVKKDDHQNSFVFDKDAECIINNDEYIRKIQVSSDRYCTQKIGQNIKLFLFSVLNFKVSKFYYF